MKWLVEVDIPTNPNYNMETDGYLGIDGPDDVFEPTWCVDQNGVYVKSDGDEIGQYGIVAKTDPKGELITLGTRLLKWRFLSRID